MYLYSVCMYTGQAARQYISDQCVFVCRWHPSSFFLLAPSLEMKAGWDINNGLFSLGSKRECSSVFLLLNARTGKICQKMFLCDVTEGAICGDVISRSPPQAGYLFIRDVLWPLEFSLYFKVQESWLTWNVICIMSGNSRYRISKRRLKRALKEIFVLFEESHSQKNTRKGVRNVVFSPPSSLHA